MKDDQEPIIGIKSETSEITYFPKFVKNTKGEWELAEPEFQKMFECHTVYEKPKAEAPKINRFKCSGRIEFLQKSSSTS